MIIVDFMIETSTPNQHYFYPAFFLGLLVEGGRQRKLLSDTFHRFSGKDYTSLSIVNREGPIPPSA